jgi:hypothetical protein
MAAFFLVVFPAGSLLLAHRLERSPPGRWYAGLELIAIWALLVLAPHACPACPSGWARIS